MTTRRDVKRWQGKWLVYNELLHKNPDQGVWLAKTPCIPPPEGGTPNIAIMPKPPKGGTPNIALLPEPPEGGTPNGDSIKMRPQTGGFAR